MPASSLPIRFFSLLAALAAGAAGVSACADSIHLDPPDGGVGGKDGGTTSTGPQGGGGGTSGECSSSQGCAYPKPVCDTVAQKCVECLTFADCEGPKPGTVCSLGACVCAADPKLTYCAGPQGQAGHCVDTVTSQTDCGGCGQACFGSCASSKCADKWRPMATAGAPSARSEHVAVWTGSKMLVWGGRTASGPTNTGGLYDPATDTWTPTSIVGAPSARSQATVVWDDVEKVAIVWGGTGPSGQLDTGAMYDPATNTWATVPTSGAPGGRTGHSAVWATFTVPFVGATHGMIVWGGAAGNTHLGDGAVFDPAAKKWVGALDGSVNGALPPSARAEHTAVWDSGLHQMIVWGGFGYQGAVDGFYLNDGAVWDPSLTGTMGAWATVSTGGPSLRARHTSVFAVDPPNASFMVVWGGYDGSAFLADGSQYKSLNWVGLSSTTTPEGREGHTAVWIPASKQMIVFGGDQGPSGAPTAFLDTAWSLDTSSQLWAPLPTAPSARTRHTAVVNGSTMLIWGGLGPGGALDTGAIYDAAP
jgi:hypothetical protein